MPDTASTDRFPTAIVTLSDRCFRGEQEDMSGAAIAALLPETVYEVRERVVLPDERGRIAHELRRLADEAGMRLVLTTGGTGFAERDVTPEATLDVVERRTPGLELAQMQVGLQATPHAMLSRAVSGIRGRTLIVNLPGSPKAVRESLSVLLSALPHGLKLLTASVADAEHRFSGDGGPRGDQ